VLISCSNPEADAVYLAATQRLEEARSQGIQALWVPLAAKAAPLLDALAQALSTVLEAQEPLQELAHCCRGLRVELPLLHAFDGGAPAQRAAGVQETLTQLQRWAEITQTLAPVSAPTTRAWPALWPGPGSGPRAWPRGCTPPRTGRHWSHTRAGGRATPRTPRTRAPLPPAATTTW
jgi:hypothetical protein